jgi:hypothetical protein
MEGGILFKFLVLWWPAHPRQPQQLHGGLTGLHGGLTHSTGRSTPVSIRRPATRASAPRHRDPVEPRSTSSSPACARALHRMWHRRLTQVQGGSICGLPHLGRRQRKSDARHVQPEFDFDLSPPPLAQHAAALSPRTHSARGYSTTGDGRLQRLCS